MSGRHTDPDQATSRAEPPFSDRIQRREWERSQREYPGPISNLVAAGISFLFLAFAPRILAALIGWIEPEAELSGPIFMILASGARWGFLIQAVIEALVLSIVILVLQAFPCQSAQFDRLPCLLSFPVLALLILPSALEIGGSWYAWLAIMAFSSLAFCIHWRAYLWAREIWD